MDGAGVKLTRIIGSHEINMLDPFLLLDCFESDQPEDYIAGFPSHPHRGFETVTYLLNGRMRHKDSAGNEGVIEPGGVQWMTAGKGIVHSEMPEQENGLLKGFQLWVNLPASEKMSEPGYQEFPPNDVALEEREDGSSIRVISGTTIDKNTSLSTTGPVKNSHIDPIYFDAQLPAGNVLSQIIPTEHNAFVYVIDGTLIVTANDQQQTIAAGTLAVLSKGEILEAQADGETEENTRFLLLAGKPLNEPVARGGPFVMNTRQEVMQAFHDFQSGQF